MTTKTVAKINNVNILIIEDGEKLVPIRPICDALGVDHKRQIDKIKEDEILSSTGGVTPSVAADGKQREMYCLPYMFIFGWLFTINPKNVKPEAQEAVKRYRMECYKALFQHFTDQSQFLEDKQQLLEKKMDEVDRIRDDFKNAQNHLKEARQELNKVKELTFEEWRAANGQLTLDL